MPNIKQYLPELNHYFTTYWQSYGELAIPHLPIPETESNTNFYPNNSVIELLFNNNYQPDESGDSYNYLFKQIKTNTLEKSSQRRLNVYGGHVLAYITDLTGDIDIYNLEDSTSDSRIMLDHLLNYRLGNNPDISDIDYSGLGNKLSKLIFLYLDLNINGIYRPLESSTPISESNSILENMFELYLMNESHRLIRTWKDFIEADVLELRPVRKRYIVDEELATLRELTINDTLPHDTARLSIFKNAIYIEPSNYSMVSDTSSLIVSFEDELSIVENDIVILDYFTTVEI